MKKRTLTAVFATLLLLAACNTDESTTGANKESEVETENKTEEPKTDEKTKVQQVVIFGGDANAEKIVASDTVDYDESKGDDMTKFLIDQLDLTKYYNKHTVSTDEKKISLDFKEDILTADLVQGSAGAYIFSESLAVTFFKNLPTLETLEVRVNGEEKQLDHTSIFTGTLTRAELETKHPELMETKAR